ncbi:unnamed protein product [Candidula unifasciata]|uniref:Uncharacterized protein n=1 Tax=Candidula unifasciata TaxID=100452 RepID=A0A8S3YUZ7_9EUPU|nr:unnamed protein product [Candidula unifasciata]
MFVLNSCMCIYYNCSIGSFFLDKSSGEQFGICVETCSLDPNNPNGFGECEAGYVCKSTGCGHTCQLGEIPVPNDLGLTDCAPGYECKSNGCGVTCQPGECTRCFYDVTTVFIV